jgi:type IV secretion system protein VirB9
MRKAMVVVAVASMVPLVAHALERPVSSLLDQRIKHVAYNDQNVVRIDAVIGIATHIILQPGEEYVTHAFGDANGWEFAHKEHHYFIKPKALNSDTNLSIVTNRRNYNFVLHFIGKEVRRAESGTLVTRDVRSPWTVRDATLQVEFTYPKEAAQSDDLKRRFEGTGTTGYSNLKYTMSATARDREIAPANVWDDARFTYFKFYPNTELPNVYTVAPDGTEALVNRHMLDREGSRVIVAEKVARKFRLRLGESVVGIYNEGFQPEGVANTSGTSTPTVRRLVRGR